MQAALSRRYVPMLDLLSAIFHLGLPVALITYFVFRRLYLRGDLDHNHNYNAIKASLKEIKQQRRDKNEKGHYEDYLHNKWMQFGGGFYGVAAVWTFIEIEIEDTYHFVVDFPGLDVLLENGVIGLIIGFFVNQITNFIQALVWFAYWIDQPERSFIAWFAVA